MINYCGSFFILGESPSGKAPGFGPGIRGFESLHPSQEKRVLEGSLFLG